MNYAPIGLKVEESHSHVFGDMVPSSVSLAHTKHPFIDKHKSNERLPPKCYDKITENKTPQQLVCYHASIQRLESLLL